MSKINSIILLDFKCLKQRTKLSFYYQYICFHPSRFDSQDKNSGQSNFMSRSKVHFMSNSSYGCIFTMYNLP